MVSRALRRRQGGGPPGGPHAPGFRADLVVLDPDHPSLAGREGDLLLDLPLFAPGSAIRDVMVGGAWRVRAGHHAAEASVSRAYRRTVARLLTASGADRTAPRHRGARIAFGARWRLPRHHGPGDGSSASGASRGRG